MQIRLDRAEIEKAVIAHINRMFREVVEITDIQVQKSGTQISAEVTRRDEKKDEEVTD